MPYFEYLIKHAVADFVIKNQQKITKKVTPRQLPSAIFFDIPTYLLVVFLNMPKLFHYYLYLKSVSQEFNRYFLVSKCTLIQIFYKQYIYQYTIDELLYTCYDIIISTSIPNERYSSSVQKKTYSLSVSTMYK